MSSGSDDENAADNASRDEASHEVLGTEDRNSSGEETASSATSVVTMYENRSRAAAAERTSGAPVGLGSETTSGVSSVLGGFQGSQEISSQPSGTMDTATMEIPTLLRETILRHIREIALPVEYLRDLSRNHSDYDLGETEREIVDRRINNYRIYGTTNLGVESIANISQRQKISLEHSKAMKIVTRILPLGFRQNILPNPKRAGVQIEVLLNLALHHRQYNLTDTELETIDRLINNYYSHGTTDFVVASGENIPQRSSADENVDPRNEEVASKVEQGVPPQDVPPQGVPPQDVPPQGVPPPQAPMKVNILKRISEQRKPWIAYYKEYGWSIVLAFSLGSIGLILIFLRFCHWPSPYPSIISICGGVLMLIRNTFTHFLIPEGPPFLAQENGEPIYEIGLVRRNDFRDPDVSRHRRSKCRAYFCCCCKRPR